MSLHALLDLPARWRQEARRLRKERRPSGGRATVQGQAAAYENCARELEQVLGRTLWWAVKWGFRLVTTNPPAAGSAPAPPPGRPGAGP